MGRVMTRPNAFLVCHMMRVTPNGQYLTEKPVDPYTLHFPEGLFFKHADALKLRTEHAERIGAVLAKLGAHLDVLDAFITRTIAEGDSNSVGVVVIGSSDSPDSYKHAQEYLDEINNQVNEAFDIQFAYSVLPCDQFSLADTMKFDILADSFIAPAPNPTGYAHLMTASVPTIRSVMEHLKSQIYALTTDIAEAIAMDRNKEQLEEQCIHKHAAPKQLNEARISALPTEVLTKVKDRTRLSGVLGNIRHIYLASCGSLNSGMEATSARGIQSSRVCH